MNMNQMKYLTEIPEILMDDSITEYKGYDPLEDREEVIIFKREDEIYLHAGVYGFLEENELMDDLLDYFAAHKVFSKMIVFDDSTQSVIKLDY